MNNFNNNFGMMNYGGNSLYPGGNVSGTGVDNYSSTNDISNTEKGGNQMNYQNQKKENYVPLELNLEPIEFDGMLKTKLTTTTELAKMVNELFRGVFSDYEGCLILPNSMGGFDTTIYFRDKGIKDNRINALEHVVQQQAGRLDINQRINNLNMRYKNKTYDLTKGCKEIFGEFMIPERNKKINWNRNVVEKTENSYNGYTIYVQLNGVDIMKVIKKIYGSKVDGRRTDYSMKLERGIGIVNERGIYANYLVSIMQLDTREVEKIAQSVGMVPLQGNIPMVR